MRRLALALTLAGLLGAGPARADESARQAFAEGKHLRDEGDCAGAIAAFDRSLAGERSIGAFYNLGFCHEQLGHRHEAYEAYRAARELASQKRDGRLREISGALAALLESPHIRVVLPQPLPTGLELRVDDELVPPATYAAETVVFTRANKYHLVIASAPTYEERRLTVESRQIAPMELQKAPPPVVVTAPPPPAEEPAPAPRETGHRTLGLVLGGAGLAAAGASAFVFTRHLASVHDARANLATAEQTPCTPAPTCGEDRRKRYNADIETQNRNAWLSVGGSAVVAAGLLVSGLWLVTRRPTGATERTTALRIAPAVGTTTRGAVVSGAF